MPEHPHNSKPIHLIETGAALAQCLSTLQGSDAIALDLEFDSHNNAYGVTLCLIQVASRTACYVIDPLAGIDLTGLFALFADEMVQKIVHAAGEDLRLLHSLQCYPKNVFDTETVARLLDYEQTSIAALLQQKLDITLSKQQQKSNWLRRPLTEAQVCYAADDVAYLHALKDVLVAEATPKQLMSFVAEEQDALSRIIYKQEVKENFLKPADLYTLSPRQQYILNNLFQYRDQLAQQLNKPAFHIMDEASLRALADGSMQPEIFPHEKSIHRFLKNDGAIRRFAGRIAAARQEADDRGLSDRKPPREHLTPAQHAAKEKAARDRSKKFQPIQQALAAKMGTYCARFIFSNTLVNELLAGRMKLADLKPYRAALVRTLAAELDIDLSDYA